MFDENKFSLFDLEYIDNSIFKTVVEDLSALIKKTGYVFNIVTSMGKSPTFHILNGSEDEDLNGKNTITFFKKENASNIYKTVEELSRVNDFYYNKRHPLFKR